MKIEFLLEEAKPRVLIPDAILPPEEDDRDYISMIDRHHMVMEQHGRRYIFLANEDGKIERVPMGGFCLAHILNGD